MSKGFLRHRVLKLLNEKPLSGSEVMNQIESKTHGHWTPSPSMIYPLLRWLQDDGQIREVPSEEGGVKRYTVTDKGKASLEEYEKGKEHFRKERTRCASPFCRGMWFQLPREKAVELHRSMRRFMAAFFELGSNQAEQVSEQAIDEALKLLNNTTEKFEEINQKLKGEPDE